MKRADVRRVLAEGREVGREPVRAGTTFALGLAADPRLAELLAEVHRLGASPEEVEALAVNLDGADLDGLAARLPDPYDDDAEPAALRLARALSNVERQRAAEVEGNRSRLGASGGATASRWASIREVLADFAAEHPKHSAPRLQRALDQLSPEELERRFGLREAPGLDLLREARRIEKKRRDS